MKDPEFIQLRNRFLIALLVTLIFTIPMLFFVINRFSVKPSKIIRSVNNKEDVVVLVTENNCSKCEKTSKILKDNKVKYIEINRSIENNNYETILKKIEMSKDDILPPTIIYIKKGTLDSSLVPASEEEILMYLDYNKLSSTK